MEGDNARVKQILLLWPSLDETARSAICGAAGCKALSLTEAVSALVEDRAELIQWALKRQALYDDRAYSLKLRVHRERRKAGLMDGAYLKPYVIRVNVRDTQTVGLLKLLIAAETKADPDAITFSNAPLHTDASPVGVLNFNGEDTFDINIDPAMNKPVALYFFP